MLTSGITSPPWTGLRPSGSADPVNCAGRGQGAIGLPRPKMKIAAPSFTRLMSLGTKVAPGTSGGTVMSASQPW
ncbi:hypothetical protein BB934_34815 (plasmid) [Microvirga ossetica]|uniref:Uncharacterized protein n=1 Tax=Microvirga ossetica TaxID=1882682 RepID=A0A1B2EU15_9HYPH|nr:hypothetical protein BB934_34815 [Microvirga ossetica]